MFIFWSGHIVPIKPSTVNPCNMSINFCLFEHKVKNSTLCRNIVLTSTDILPGKIIRNYEISTGYSSREKSK